MKTKPMTWAELKDFTDSIPKEFLNDKAVVFRDDEEANGIVSGFSSDIYRNSEDPEDFWDPESFELEKEAGNIENPESFEFEKGGHPYLTTEF